MQSLSEKCTNILDTSSSSSSSSPSTQSKPTYPSFFDRSNEKFIKTINTTATKFQDPLSLKMNSLKIEMYPTPWSQIAATLADELAPKGLSCLSNNSSSMTTNTTATAAPNGTTNENDSENTNGGKSCSSSNSHKLNRKTRNRKSLRYMTQPITLIEIKETEEDCNFVQADSVATKPPVVSQSEPSEQAAEDSSDFSGSGVDSTTFANTQLNSQTSYYDQMSFARRQNRKTIERSKIQRTAGNVSAFD